MKQGIGIFVLYQNKLMLILRDDKEGISNPCRHALVGGAVESGESFIDAALRELEEETKCAFDKARLVPVGTEKNSLLGQHNEFFLTELTETDYEGIFLLEGQKYDFHVYHEVRTLHSRGNAKHGLGGAISRFMHSHPDTIARIISGEHTERFYHHT